MSRHFVEKITNATTLRLAPHVTHHLHRKRKGA